VSALLAPRIDEDGYGDYDGLEKSLVPEIDLRVIAPDFFGLKEKKITVADVEEYFKSLDPDMPLSLAIEMYDRMKVGV